MLTIQVSADENVRDNVRELVRARAHQEVRLMELDFQPRRQIRLWETMWNQIVWMVDRHYHSGADRPTTKKRADISLSSARDPETGLHKPDVSFSRNVVTGAAARRGFRHGKRDSAAQNTLIRRLRSAVKDPNDNSGTVVGISDDLDTLVGTDDDSSTLVDAGDGLETRAVNARKSYEELEKKSRREG